MRKIMTPRGAPRTIKEIGGRLLHRAVDRALVTVAAFSLAAGGLLVATGTAQAEEAPPEVSVVAVAGEGHEFEFGQSDGLQLSDSSALSDGAALSNGATDGTEQPSEQYGSDTYYSGESYTYYDGDGYHPQREPSEVAPTDLELIDDGGSDTADSESEELDDQADPGYYAEANAPPVAEVEEGIIHDLAADWDYSAPGVIAPGAQTLAWFSVNANDVQFGTGGHTNFTIVLDAENGIFTGFGYGTVSNNGRTLTVEFRDFELGHSIRFGFAMMPIGPGYIGASVTVIDDDGAEANTANVPLRPVGPGSTGWDVIQAIYGGSVGAAHDQHLSVPFNLGIARDAFLPQGDLVFDLTVSATHAGGHGFLPHYRLAFPLAGAVNTGQVVELPLAGEASTNTIANRGGQRLRARIDSVPGGYRFTFPAQYLQPWLDLQPEDAGVTDLDPRVRIFGAAQVGFALQTNPGQAAAWSGGGIIGLATNVSNAAWAGIPETDFGPVTNQCGQNTVNNRRCFILFGTGGGAVQWGDASSSLVTNAAAALWNAYGTHNLWSVMPGLQTNTVAHGAGWTANSFVPGGSQIASLSHQILLDGASHTASCYLINPAVTPFLGRAVVHGASPRVWVTTQTAGLDAACYTMGGWHEIGSHGQVAHNQHAFNIPGAGAVTAIRVLAHSDHFLFAMHETQMGNPAQGGWMTGAHWTTNSADVNDMQLLTRNSGQISATPGQPFPYTTDTRDVVFGNYGFPQVRKSASNLAPMLNETVTFTIQAMNRSNQGHMAMVVHDQIDHRLHFVPGSVRINGVPAADPTISGPQVGSHVPGSTVRHMTFDLGNQPVNHVFTITYQAVARWAEGAAFNTAWMVPTAEAAARGGGVSFANGTMAQTRLDRHLSGTMTLTKQAARSHMGPNAGALAGTVSAQNAWLLSVENGTAQPAQSAVVDIFPFYGDGRGTTDNVLHQVTFVATDHPVTVWYTTADAATVNPDPWHASNESPGADGSPWRQFATLAAGAHQPWLAGARPTAMMIVTDQPIPSMATAIYQIGFTALTNYGEQGTFVNYAWQRDNANQLRLVRAATTISEFPEITVYKHIEGESLVGTQPGTELTVTFDLVNTGTEPLTRITFVDETLVGPEVADIVFHTADGAEYALNADGHLASVPSGALLVLAPGEAIAATGVLPGMYAGERHENIVHVTGVGFHTGDSVVDDDPLVVETVAVHISKDILDPVNGHVDEVSGVVFLDIDPVTGLTAPQVVTFTITNLSSEGLTYLVFQDRIEYGQQISDIAFDPAIVESVTVTDEIVTVVFVPEFVLGVGEHFSGTGLLAGLAAGEWHHNIASIWGEGSETGEPAEDGTDQPGVPGGPGEDDDDTGADGPDLPRLPVPDNELVADTVGIRLVKYIDGAPVNEQGWPILEADEEGFIPEQEVTFRITNIGTEPLTNLVFTDVTLELPALTAVWFPTQPDAVVTALNDGNDWLVEFGQFVFHPGEQLVGHGTLPRLTGEGLKHHNVATIVAEGVESGRVVDDVDDLRIDPADLEITKSVASDDGQYRAGGNVTWTLTITNHGPDRAVNVTVEDRLENAAQAAITSARFTTLPEGRDSRIAYNPAGVAAWVEHLDVGEVVVITVNGTLASHLQVGDVVVNVATVGSDTPDPNPANNTARAELPIRNVAATPVSVAELALTGASVLGAAVAVVMLITGGGALLASKRGRHAR